MAPCHDSRPCLWRGLYGWATDRACRWSGFAGRSVNDKQRKLGPTLGGAHHIVDCQFSGRVAALEPAQKSRRNVAHHYDLSDALFDTFLDPWRQYSCAYFHDPDESLDNAQVNKLARLAAKLDLQAGDNILDIG
ncbi:MAG: hypothetical protein CMN39_06275, partial [SAR116 cluster bacterium]|nr:hypothetical protein [SAR116 cluster bacterium]